MLHSELDAQLLKGLNIMLAGKLHVSRVTVERQSETVHPHLER